MECNNYIEFANKKISYFFVKDENSKYRTVESTKSATRLFI